jgi:hypothetical protein
MSRNAPPKGSKPSIEMLSALDLARDRFGWLIGKRVKVRVSWSDSDSTTTDQFEGKLLNIESLGPVYYYVFESETGRVWMVKSTVVIEIGDA